MFECDGCGKKFYDEKGASIGPISPMFNDRMVYCAECVKKHEEERKKRDELKKMGITS